LEGSRGKQLGGAQGVRHIARPGRIAKTTQGHGLVFAFPKARFFGGEHDVVTRHATVFYHIFG
jgi:hypothetical protein